MPAQTAPKNAGSLAHMAMSVWVESGEWLSDSPGPSLQSAWDEEAVRWSVDSKRLSDSVMTRSRLKRRGAELASLLGASGSGALSEVVLMDDRRRLYGQLDVIVDGADGGAVVDLKTGDDGTSEISEAVRTQLLIYAHLFGEKFGHLPGVLVAFSLRHGAVQLDYSQSDVDALLALIENARIIQPRLAMPGPTGCRFCRRRLTCEPHWEAAAMWNDRDSVEGRIVKVETAQSGLTAIRLETSRGAEWVTGLTAAGVDSAIPGSFVRVTEVTGRGADGDERDWRATRSTRTLVVPR